MYAAVRHNGKLVCHSMRNYAVITCVITRNYPSRYITLALRMFTRKVRNYAVITHFTHLQRNAAIVTRNPRTLVQCLMSAKEAYPESLREFHRIILLPHDLAPLV